MNPTAKRAGAYALVGSLSLTAPVLEAAAFVPFAIVAIVALVVVTEGPLFELFARPGDREDGRLYALTGFALAATGLGLLIMFGLPVEIYTAVICLLVFGNFVDRLLPVPRSAEVLVVAGFTVGAFVSGTIAYVFSATIADGSVPAIPAALFLAASGALVAAILRSLLFERDDPLVLLTVGILLWFFADLGIRATTAEILVALAVTVALGYVSYALDTASVTGMLTGILLGLLTIVLGGYGWFVVLIAFFSIGGLSTKYRYEEKYRRGVAEENRGARGTGNVLSNSAVALVAVVGFAASRNFAPAMATVFLFAFTGAVATALSDTLSSEIGGIYDNPRLITTFETVAPGTNGGITWQGKLAGAIGAATVAGIALALFDEVEAVGALVICVAGVLGMTADSLFGATIEERWLNNQGVNFLATLVGALVCAVLAIGIGIP